MVQTVGSCVPCTFQMQASLLEQVLTSRDHLKWGEGLEVGRHFFDPITHQLAGCDATVLLVAVGGVRLVAQLPGRQCGGTFENQATIGQAVCCGVGREPSLPCHDRRVLVVSNPWAQQSRSRRPVRLVW